MDTTSSRSKSKSKDLTLSSDTSNKSLIKTVSNHKPQDVTVTSQYSVSDPYIMMAAYSKSSRQVVQSPQMSLDSSKKVNFTHDSSNNNEDLLKKQHRSSLTMYDINQVITSQTTKTLADMVVAQ
jgi:hypothetical protein